VPWGDAPGTPLDIPGLTTLAVLSRSFAALRVLARHIRSLGGSVSLEGIFGKGAAEELEVGEQVVASGPHEIWFPACIVEKRDDGDYLLAWEDGNAEDRVKSRDKLHRVTVAGRGMCSAAGRGDIAAVKLLLELGGDANLRNGINDAPLHVAALAGDEVMCRVLLGAGADKDATANKRYTAAHVAALYGRMGPLQALLDARADMNLESEDRVSTEVTFGRRDLSLRPLLGCLVSQE